MTGYLYTPGAAGDWLVVAATGRLLLARIDGDAARAERCLAVLDAGTSVSNLVDILSSQGLESTGPFALLFWVDGDMGGKGLGVIVRGTPEVTVHSDGGDVRVVAGGFMTWSEQLVDGATGFTVETGAASAGSSDAASDAPASPLDLPFTGGAVWATSVATDAAASALSGARGAEAAAQAVAQLTEVDDAIDGATVIVPTRARRREQAAANAAPEANTAATSALSTSAAESAASPAESAASPAESDANPAESADSDVPATPVEETRVFHTTTASSAANATSAASPAGPASDADSYDYLFGATIFRPVGQAAVAEEDEEDGEASGSPASASVPASSTATAATPTVASGDHDGSTVFSTDIRQAREESRARAGGDQAGASAASAPAPALGDSADAHRFGGYVLVLPDGRSQELNAPVIIGRAPSVSNVPASVLPHLITLSADDISRNHVRIAVEGGTVVVTDLLSSNGTQVIQPGKPPLSLRGGEPTPVIVGTVVDLGSGITLTIAEA
ncbi:hypothetical protein ALI44B_13270 [Leifsonia sp. ALI-44-B]|uniref:FHA domain-containing protein n=1 Tax=Leifsonia sp. ALI-44-B TaxID=1933776 RepID=UPI00097BC6E7|nr:FHA domain-containing protein [Leifsonia sp. ALI-44-B]ONI61389.1 hypothetical protein ALI44B_13270 [Leifsonia sp. ALI-44-B]